MQQSSRTPNYENQHSNQLLLLKSIQAENGLSNDMGLVDYMSNAVGCRHGDSKLSKVNESPKLESILDFWESHLEYQQSYMFHYIIMGRQATTSYTSLLETA